MLETVSELLGKCGSGDSVLPPTELYNEACVAYLPYGVVRKHSRGFRCEPATFRGGTAVPRRDYAKFFDEEGLRLVEQPDWPKLIVGDGPK